jgi:hypothetical protein
MTRPGCGASPIWRITRRRMTLDRSSKCDRATVTLSRRAAIRSYRSALAGQHDEKDSHYEICILT